MGKSDFFEGTNRHSSSKRPMSPKNNLEQDKRLRREIANSNERRRMQSINAGFHSLKNLLPKTTNGEKLSKAAILQQTSDYIDTIEHEKTRLLSQNAHLKRMLAELSRNAEMSPPPKRKKRDTESSDEGIGLSTGEFDESTMEDIKREMIELRSQLERERRMRMMLEEQTRQLESQLYPERFRNLTSQVQAQMKFQEEKQHFTEEQQKAEEEKEKPNPLATSLSPQQKCPPVTTTTTTPFMNPSASSMSRRNLETIVEAIRHLEGDSVLLDNVKVEPNTMVSAPLPPKKEHLRLSQQQQQVDIEMEKENTNIKMEAKPIVDEPSLSPIRMSVDEEPSAALPGGQHTTLHVDSRVITNHKYPIATQLLHTPPLPQQFLQRPGVIVHNLS